jgi:hypothetical protein
MKNISHLLCYINIQLPLPYPRHLSLVSLVSRLRSHLILPQCIFPQMIRRLTFIIGDNADVIQRIAFIIFLGSNFSYKHRYNGYIGIYYHW